MHLRLCAEFRARILRTAPPFTNLYHIYISPRAFTLSLSKLFAVSHAARGGSTLSVRARARALYNLKLKRLCPCTPYASNAVNEPLERSPFFPSLSF